MIIMWGGRGKVHFLLHIREKTKGEERRLHQDTKWNTQRGEAHFPTSFNAKERKPRAIPPYFSRAP